MEVKCCNRCGNNKPIKDFRERRSIYNGRITVYLNNNCRICDKELALEYHNRKKNDPEYRQKAKDRAKKHWQDNRDKNILIYRERNATPEQKQYMKEYRKRNADKIREQQRLRNHEWIVKQRSEISEQYILQLLTHPREGLGNREDVRKYPELINFYQSHIKFKRQWKQLQTSQV